jgi:hypothetical protein
MASSSFVARKGPADRAGASCQIIEYRWCGKCSFIFLFSECAYLYDAQPPPFKAKRGKTSRDLKGEPEIEDYLFGLSLDGATVMRADGEDRDGDTLRELPKNASACPKSPSWLSPLFGTSPA